MLKIRLQRVGRKNVPVFRVVLTDSKNSTKSGRFLEILGSYNPVQKTKLFKEERIKHWLGQGAQLSETLHNMFVSEKIITGKKINVLPKKSPIKKDEPEGEKKEEVKADASAETTEVPATETPKEEAKAEEPAKEEAPKEEPKTEEAKPEETPKEEAKV